MNPVISVFVPTRNRYEYLKNLVLLIESYHDPRIELVIQDNSDDNSDFLPFLNSVSPLSTKYYYYSGFLSMSENSNLGFKHCNGEFVCMIGDDDAVCRNIADCAEWMRENNVDALRSSEVQFIYDGERDDILYYDTPSNEVKKINPMKALRQTLNKGLIDFGLVPKLYHGIVAKRVLDSFLEKHNKTTVFPGCTPDMSGAILTTCIVNNYVKIGIPVILSGTSKMNSGGLSGQILKLDEVPWITQETRDSWEKDVPKIWAREFIWPESGSKGLRFCGHSKMLKYMDYYMMRARYLIMHKQHRKAVIQTSPSKLRLLLAYIKTLVFVGGRYIYNRQIKARFNHKMNGVYEYTKTCHSIKEVEDFFYKNGYQISFSSLVFTNKQIK